MRMPLPDLGNVLAVPGRLLGGLALAGDLMVRETAALLAALHALPRLAAALDRLAPAADSLAALAETRDAIEEIADGAQHPAHTLDQLRVVHEQVVTLACDLRVLEPEIQELARTAAALDRSIRVLASALGPLQSTTERVGRLVDRLPDRRRSGP
jgi:hypothetical protein